MTIYSVAQNVLLSGVFLSAIAWLVRELFKQFLSRDLEKFKADLEKESIGFKIRYEKLQSERLEVVKETHKRVTQTLKNFFKMITPLQVETGKDAEKRRQQTAFDSLITLTDYFEENAIFFDKSLETAIQKLISDFHQCWRDYQDARDTEEYDRKKAVNAWGAVWEHIRSETPKVQGELKDRFREVLGVGNQ